MAVIPARAGSKRVPKKNLRDFCGRPLLSWTIQAALDSAIFSDVVVSTDSEEIKRVAEDHGASVPFLRNNFVDDYSHAAKATIETVERLLEHNSAAFSSVVQLMPVCPLRGAASIVEAADFFLGDPQRTSVVSANKPLFQPPWWAAQVDSTGHPEYLFPSKLSARSQDLPDLYFPNGAVWISDVEALKNSGTFYSEGHRLFEMPWRESLDIDSDEDFEFTEMVRSWMN